MIIIEATTSAKIRSPTVKLTATKLVVIINITIVTTKLGLITPFNYINVN
jgi:hypothetical protein